MSKDMQEKLCDEVLFNKIAGMKSRHLQLQWKNASTKDGLPVNILELFELLQEGLAWAQLFW